MSDRDPKISESPKVAKGTGSDPMRPKNAPLIVDVDAGTLLAVIMVILFIPLLLTGFISH